MWREVGFITFLTLLVARTAAYMHSVFNAHAHFNVSNRCVFDRQYTGLEKLNFLKNERVLTMVNINSFFSNII
jgi:hypothetical protein